MVKLSLRLPISSRDNVFADEMSYETIEAYVLNAERLGYSTVFAADRVSDSNEMSELDAWMLIGALAQRTKRMRIGTLGLDPTGRNPAFMAKMAGTLDYLAGGRLDLGIAPSPNPCSKASYSDGEDDSTDGAGERFAEAIELMKCMFTQRETSFAGRFFSAKDATCMPGPLQKPWPRLWIGDEPEGGFPVAAAKHGDSWISRSVPPDAYASRTSDLSARCEAVGRDFNEVERAIETRALVIESDEDVALLAEWAVSGGAGGAELQAGRTDVIRVLKQKYIIGTAEECFQRVSEYESAGAQHLVIHFMDYPRTRTIEAFASHLVDRNSRTGRP